MNISALDNFVFFNAGTELCGLYLLSRLSYISRQYPEQNPIFDMAPPPAKNISLPFGQCFSFDDIDYNGLLDQIYMRDDEKKASGSSYFYKYKGAVFYNKFFPVIPVKLLEGPMTELAQRLRSVKENILKYYGINAQSAFETGLLVKLLDIKDRAGKNQPGNETTLYNIFTRLLSRINNSSQHTSQSPKSPDNFKSFIPADTKYADIIFDDSNPEQQVFYILREEPAFLKNNLDADKLHYPRLLQTLLKGNKKWNMKNITAATQKLILQNPFDLKTPPPETLMIAVEINAKKEPATLTLQYENNGQLLETKLEGGKRNIPFMNFLNRSNINIECYSPDPDAVTPIFSMTSPSTHDAENLRKALETICADFNIPEEKRPGKKNQTDWQGSFKSWLNAKVKHIYFKS